MRSNKGRGTTVKVSLPLRPIAPAPSIKSHTSSLDFSSSPLSAGFVGFGTLDTGSNTEPIKAEANMRLLGSMRKYCMQLGMPVHAADDNLNSNASVHIVSEQALERLIRNNDKDLRRSLLSTGSLREPMIIICATRDSALRLRSAPLSSSLPVTTQYLWLPIGPAKLAGALSACCTYHEEGTLQGVEPVQCIANTTLVNAPAENDSGATVMGATQALSQTAGEEGRPTHNPSPKNIGRDVQDEDEGSASSVEPTNTDVDREQLQVPQSPRPKRSGSEAANKPITFSLRLRAQINRATTAPCVSTGTLSLLLVDDNVTYSLKLVISNLADNSNRLLIFAFSKYLLNGPDMSTIQRETAGKLWRSTKALRNKSVERTTITTQMSSWPSSQKSY